jgi:hypothetical protein
MTRKRRKEDESAMKKFLLAVVAIIVLDNVAHAEQRVDCVGVVTSRPVHLGDVSTSPDGHGNLDTNGIADNGRKQSEKCDSWFESKNWKKVTDVCHEDKLCHVVGVVGSKGWKRVIKVEDYSEAD